MSDLTGALIAIPTVLFYWWAMDRYTAAMWKIAHPKDDEWNTWWRIRR